MQGVVRNLVAVFLAIGAPAVYAAGIGHPPPTSLFVMTNDASNNEVLAYQRSAGDGFVLKG